MTVPVTDKKCPTSLDLGMCSRVNSGQTGKPVRQKYVQHKAILIKQGLTMHLNRKTRKHARHVNSSHCYYYFINMIQLFICCTINLIHCPQMVEIIRHWALAENAAILFSHSCQGVNSHEQFPFMETDPDVLIPVLIETFFLQMTFILQLVYLNDKFLVMLLNCGSVLFPQLNRRKS